MPLPSGKSFSEFVQEIKEKQGVSEESARKIVGSIEQRIKKSKAQLQFMQIKNALLSLQEQAEANRIINRESPRVLPPKPKPRRNINRRGFDPTGKKKKQTVQDFRKKKFTAPGRTPKRITGSMLRQRNVMLSKNKHLIQWKTARKCMVRTAALIEDDGKYAKYWLLNSSDTNGNGWGVKQASIKKNILSFIGRPFVITSKQWIANSMYGDIFDHPHIPTNDMNLILKHQEHFRVATIVDVHERNGQWFAIIKRDPKYAHLNLPPFCSPAIYQLDALEHDEGLSKWEGLHLAGLDENPAYGARIALLRGTCSGPPGQCIHQLKEAKLRTATIHDRPAEPTSRFNPKTPLLKEVPFGKKSTFEESTGDVAAREMVEDARRIKPNIKIGPPTATQRNRQRIIKARLNLTKQAVKLIKDKEIRELREKIGPEGNFPDDSMKRSPRISQQNFRIQTRGIAMDRLKKLSEKTRRDNPKTPLRKEVPFGPDKRPLKNTIGQTLEEEDLQDANLSLDFADENNPISDPLSRSQGFLKKRLKKPKRSEFTKIIKAKIKAAQLRSQTNSAVNRVNVLGTRKKKKKVFGAAIFDEQEMNIDIGSKANIQSRQTGRKVPGPRDKINKTRLNKLLKSAVKVRPDSSKRPPSFDSQGKPIPKTPGQLASIKRQQDRIRKEMGIKLAFLEPTTTFSNSFRKKKLKIPKIKTSKCTPCAAKSIKVMKAKTKLQKLAQLPLSGKEIVRRFTKVSGKIPRNKGFTFIPETGALIDVTEGPAAGLKLRKALGAPKNADTFFDANTRGITKVEDLIPNLDKIKGRRLIGGFVDNKGNFELDATTPVFGGTKGEDILRLTKENQKAGMRVSQRGETEFFDNPNFKK